MLLNSGMTEERTPGNAAARNKASCWRLFEESVAILEAALGTKLPVPAHPDDVKPAGPAAEPAGK